ncbi:hypothetical protein GQ600_12650 [Phytophthora cactorum]|nr:hypothetical protein GQ600_12650 [Phytophthora cactorum]
MASNQTGVIRFLRSVILYFAEESLPGRRTGKSATVCGLHTGNGAILAPKCRAPPRLVRNIRGANALHAHPLSTMGAVSQPGNSRLLPSFQVGSRHP